MGLILVYLAQIWAPKFFSRFYLHLKGKLINQTWENGKKPNFGPDFCPFWPKFGPQFFLFFVGATSIRCYTLLQTIIVCNFKENQRTKLEKMAKNLVLGPIFAQLAQIRPAIFFFFKLLALSVTRYHGQLLSCTVWENLMIQCWENSFTKVRTERWTDGWVIL